MDGTAHDRKPQEGGEPPVRKQKGCLLFLILLSAVLIISVCQLYCLKLHYKTVTSPCGKYRAEAYYYFRESIMPMMPGSGGDKSGRLYIVRNEDNRRLFQMELPMVSFINNICFIQDSKGNTKTIYAPFISDEDEEAFRKCCEEDNKLE